MLDNYAGLLCASFIHIRLFDSLCWLCSHGDIDISCRSKDLLVDLMGVVSKVCTERVCSDLLTLPSLIEYAASASSMKFPDRAYKAADLLMALSNAFSVSKAKDSYSRQASLDTRPMSAAVKSNKKLSGRNLELSPSKKDPIGQPLSSVVETLDQTSFSSGAINSKRGELAHELKLFMNSSIDKAEFSKQMDMTRILGKEGKEPFKWDWAIIGDLLDYSLRNPERLNEALKTKFVKRLSGFYRCSTEEKGYFANLEWEPTHLHFLESACNLYFILSENEASTHFLSSDRRGMVFAELVRDLEAVITHAASTKSNNPSNVAALLTGQAYKNVTLNVFRPAGCMQTMSREYFCLIGRLCHSTPGRYLLNSCQTYDHLSHLSHYVSLDYLSRVVLTALGFTDGGFMSKDLLQIYTTSGATSTNLRLYCHTLLRALLRSRTKECCEWGIELMVEQLMFPHSSRKSILRLATRSPFLVLTSFLSCRCIEEAVQDRDSLKILISKEPEVAGDDMDNLVTRFLAIEEGISYLEKLNWVEPQLTLWRTVKCKEYASRVEMSLAKALNTTYMKHQQSASINPIPIHTPAFSSHPSASSGLQYPDGMVDIEGLLRVPWNIEVKISAPSGVSMGDPEYLKIDAYLDSSDLACPSSGDMTSDNLRIIKVRGIVLDSKGNPFPQPILNDRTIMTSLLCGVCPIMRDGTVVPSSEWLSPQVSNPSYNNLTAGSSAPSESKSSNSNVPHNSIHRRRKSVLKSSYSTSDMRSIRSSYSDPPPLDLGSTQEPPVTLLSDGAQDWVRCKPSHRQKIRQSDVGSSSASFSTDDDRFSIEIPGEPVVLIFSRYPPRLKAGNNDRNTPPPRYNGNSHAAYLVEVHYYLKLQTGQSSFLPLPRHLYGELARSSAGIMILLSNRIIRDLLATLNSSATSPSDIISSLWALGHIAATENGFQAVISNDPQFVPWCIGRVTDASSYSVRACAFSVLGLLSRTETGSQQLLACHWESAPIHYVAVAMPKDPSVLFQSALPLNHELKESLSGSEGKETEPGIAKIPFQTCLPDLSSPIKKNRSPRRNSSFMGMTFDGMDDPIESDILECISKLPGQILYKDAYYNLMKHHQQHPEAFQNRHLYLAIHELMAHYNFKLNVRRLLVGLFPLPSKRMSNP
jgi:rapamycin-insensitive companion of mTOR